MMQLQKQDESTSTPLYIMYFFPERKKMKANEKIQHLDNDRNIAKMHLYLIWIDVEKNVPMLFPMNDFQRCNQYLELIVKISKFLKVD
jgi:hypothetical protein